LERAGERKLPLIVPYAALHYSRSAMQEMHNLMPVAPGIPGIFINNINTLFHKFSSHFVAASIAVSLLIDF
jgi:hypothetical protein